jgi:hypothetical protein
LTKRSIPNSRRTVSAVEYGIRLWLAAALDAMEITSEFLALNPELGGKTISKKTISFSLRLEMARGVVRSKFECKWCTASTSLIRGFYFSSHPRGGVW